MLEDLPHGVVTWMIEGQQAWRLRILNAFRSEAWPLGRLQSEGMEARRLENSLKDWNINLLSSKKVCRLRVLEARRLEGRVACSLKAWRLGGLEACGAS